MKAYLYLFVFLLFSLPAYNQFTIDWANTIYETYRQGSYAGPFMYDPDITIDPLGDTYATGLAAAGNNYDLYLGNTDVLAVGNPRLQYYLAQLNEDGQPNWLFRFSGLYRSAVSVPDKPTLFPRAEGGITLVSRVNHTVVLGRDTLAELDDSEFLLIAQINSEGEVENHSLTRMKVRSVSSVVQAQDGGIIVTGRFVNRLVRIGSELVRSEISPAYYAAKISATTGLVDWAISPEPDPTSTLVADGTLKVLEDGNVALVFSPGGFQYVSYSCPYEPHLFVINKLNGEDGSLIWQKEVAKAGFGHIRDIAERPNGDLFLVGSYGGRLTAANGESRPGLSSSCNVVAGCLFKLTADGDVYDLEVENDGFSGHRIIQLPNQQYLIGGHINVESLNSQTPEELNSGFVLKLYSDSDQLLAQENITTVRSYSYDRYFLDVEAVDDQRIICTGRYWGKLLGTDVFTPEGLSEQVFVAQLKIPEINTPVDDQVSGESLNIFPNPVRDYVNIDLGTSLFGERPVQIFNTQGQLVFEQSNIGERNEFRIPTTNLQQGSYILQVGENGPRTKLIKLGQR